MRILLRPNSGKPRQCYEPGATAVRPLPIEPTLRPAATDFGREAAPAALRGSTGQPVRPDPRVGQIADFDRSAIREDDNTSRPGSTGTAPPGSSTDLSPADTIQPAEADLRQQQDRDAFNNPPAGHNPRAFQIERLEPVRDRRTRQFFAAETDPFAHLGWRFGAFTFFQEFRIAPTWASNVFSEPNARADKLADFNSETRIVSNWSNHAIEFRMLHDRTYHHRFTSENDAGSDLRIARPARCHQPHNCRRPTGTRDPPGKPLID